MPFVKKTTTQLSFQGGLSSKSDALQLLPPALLGLQNGNFSKVGQLNKRYGFDLLSNQISGGGILTYGAALDSFNDELNLFDDNNIYTYVQANKNWSNRGTAISLINQNNQITRSVTSQQLNPDQAVLKGIEVYVYEDTRAGGNRYSVLDQTTKSYIVADQPLYGSKPKTIIFNGTVYLFHTDGICNLFYRTLNPDNPTVLGPQISLFADGFLNFSYDVTVANNQLVIAYQRDSGFGASQMVLNVYDQTINQTQSFLIDPNVDVTEECRGVNVYNDSLNQLWLTYFGTTVIETAVQATIYNSTNWSVILPPTVVADAFCTNLAGIEFTTPGSLQLVYEVLSPTGLPADQYIQSILITNSGITTDIGTLRSVGLATKPFEYKGNLYVNVTHQSTEQSTYFTVLLNKQPFTIVSKVAAQVGGGLRTNNMLGEVSTVSNGVFIWSNLIKGQTISTSGVAFSTLGVNSTVTDFTSPNKFNSVTQSNNLLFVGGILQSYDGFSANEQNFHLYPETIPFEVLPGQGALSVGQYAYQVLYSWSDKVGQIQYSTPSDPIIVSCPTVNCAVSFLLPTLRLTAKTNVAIEVYRTQINSTIFQKVTDTLEPVVNDPTVDYIQFTDKVADVALASNAPIYTTGGILPNSAPPSCSLISLYQNRCMVAGLEDKNLIWFSKNKFNNTNFNTIPTEFCSSNTIGVDPRGGSITALGLMDDKLIIFKENAIFLLTGDGPNDNGTGGAFPDPELINSNIGCNNPNSLILTKDGIMFQSTKGIWLLDRSLGVSYIGQGVDDFKDLTISSATLDQNDNLVIFTTFTGVTLVYDYFIQQWTTWSGAPTVAVDSVNFNGFYTFLKPNGRVYIQNRTTFTDATDTLQLPIRMQSITPWMSWAGMQGYQKVIRVFLLGNFRGPHQLNVDVGYDFNPSFTQSATINATKIAGSNVWGSDPLWGDSSPWGGQYQIYEFQINFKTQNCTSLRLRISDSPTSPYQEGYTLNNLNFEVGILGDGVRMPLGNKTGAK